MTVLKKEGAQPLRFLRRTIRNSVEINVNTLIFLMEEFGHKVAGAYCSLMDRKMLKRGCVLKIKKAAYTTYASAGNLPVDDRAAMADLGWEKEGVFYVKWEV